MYLEDLEPPANSQSTDSGRESTVAGEASAEPGATATSAEDKHASEKPAPAKAPAKRQRTLMDMFPSKSVESGAGGSQPAAKKLRLDKAGSSSSLMVTSGTPRTLNSIPFSPSEFVASLSEDEKRLLALECESMGKSWYVAPQLESTRLYLVC